MGKDKIPPKKKQYFIRTTSKRTGAIILISFVVIMALSISFLIYAKDFADKQKAYEDQWRLMTCQEMKLDYEKDPFVWKVVTMKDLNCISNEDFQNILSTWTR